MPITQVGSKLIKDGTIVDSDVNASGISAAKIVSISSSFLPNNVFNTAIFPGQITSTVTTGTSPFVIASQTVINNLNADLLDGQEGSYYLDATNQTGVLSIAKGGTGLNSFGSAGQFIRVNAGATGLEYATVGGTGTVTSVDLTLPGIFTVSGNPVTAAGTLSASFVSQNQNLFLASPDGVAGTPNFRAIGTNDLPLVTVSKGGTGLSSIGTAYQNLRVNALGSALEYFSEWQEIEVDFGAPATTQKTGTVPVAGSLTTQGVLVMRSANIPTGKGTDEDIFDPVVVSGEVPVDGTVQINATGINGSIGGNFKFYIRLV